MKKVFTIVLVLIIGIGLMAQTVEASRRHESVGRQIQRVAEHNIVRLVDRTLRAYVDNYVDDIYYWHRHQRNHKLQEYRASYNCRNKNVVFNYVIEASDKSGRRYAVGAFQLNRPLDNYELSGMKKVALALQTGQAFKADSHYEKRRIIELCRQAGIYVQTNGSLIYVSA